MIRSFRDRRTRLFYEEGRVPRQWRAFEEAATRLEDLRNPPGNRLEKLRGDRAGQYSIRINGQWRVCFKWIDGAAGEVEIVDYH